MESDRKSGSIRTVFDTVRPWVDVRQCTKFQENISSTFRLNTKIHVQTSDGQTDSELIGVMKVVEG